MREPKHQMRIVNGIFKRIGDNVIGFIRFVNVNRWTSLKGFGSGPWPLDHFIEYPIDIMPKRIISIHHIVTNSHA
jgi:hypothetical protein